MSDRLDTDLGVVVIGAGDMGARHAEHWLYAGARLCAVVDPDAARAEAVAARFGAAHGPEPAPFLTGAVDVVAVCTPTHLHARMTVAALEAGKHVLCEKPAALTLEGAEAMPAAARWSSSGVDPWREQIVQFHRELCRGAPVRLATVEDGIDALVTSLAVLRSVRERRPVRLDEVRRAEAPDRPAALGPSIAATERA